eukprot:g16965.t1
MARLQNVGVRCYHNAVAQAVLPVKSLRRQLAEKAATSSSEEMKNFATLLDRMDAAGDGYLLCDKTQSALIRSIFPVHGRDKERQQDAQEHIARIFELALASEADAEEDSEADAEADPEADPEGDAEEDAGAGAGAGELLGAAGEVNADANGGKDGADANDDSKTGPTLYSGILPGVEVSDRAGQFIDRVSFDDGSDVLFCQAVAAEAQEYRDNVLEAYKEEKAKGGGPIAGAVWRCELCPYKSFKHCKSLLDHITRQHVVHKTEKTQKSIEHPLRGFMGVARALFDDNGKAASNVPPPWSLGEKRAESMATSTSATTLKEVQSAGKTNTVRPSSALPLCRPLRDAAKRVQLWNFTHLRNTKHDGKKGHRREDFRTLIDETGGRLLMADHPALINAVRLSHRLNFSPQLLKEIAAHSVRTKCRPWTIRERLIEEALKSKAGAARSGLAQLIPAGALLGDILRRIYDGESMQDMTEAMRINVGTLFDEYRDLSIDGTVNVTQSIVGDIPAGKKGATGNKCLTLKGRTGVVLGVKLAPGEGAAQLLDFLTESVPKLRRARPISRGIVLAVGFLSFLS